MSVKIGEGERILATQQFTLRADGELKPLVEGSTRPVGPTLTHAAIVKLRRYAFSML